MSIEPEDPLEEALRGDLPTPDAEARVRRRLLAAGVAVGNGVAAGTAAAAGTSTAGVATTASGLSWGLKLGVVAFVTIPTVGLWLDQRSTPTPLEQARPAAPAEQALPAATPEVVAHGEANQPMAAPPSEPPTVGPRPSRSAKAPAPDGARSREEPAGLAGPSQADFAAPEAPARAPQAGSTLAEETRLLDGAFAALSASNLARAATLLREHETRYPDGLLAKERERAKTRLSELSRGE
jgi:hypothetical protein